MVSRVSRAWVLSACNVKYIQNQTQQGSIFSLLALCQLQKSSRFNCVSKVFWKVQVLIICSIYSCEMGVSLSLMLHQTLYSYKPSSHASTHPHQSFLVVLFKLHVQYAPTWKIKRKTVKCLYWAFLMSIKHLRFPVVIKWKVFSHYAEQRNVDRNQKHSSPHSLQNCFLHPKAK